ncbi:MAG: sterol desaturase family protein [Deltaproteobacteria bacterium]|nr:sterol desaturase family protein [Deltaproteobacteria bacterium]
MSALMDLLARHPVPLGLFALFLVLAAAETLRPLRRLKRRRGPRWTVNLGITALSFAAGSLVVRPVALGLAVWATQSSYGFLHWLPLPAWTHAALGFLWLDLTFYWWHRANHVYPLLWRFHNVHHVDPDMDVTTSFRFHFGETLYSTAFRVLQVGLAGVGPATYLLYEIFFNVATMFHHSNLRLPLALERVLNLVTVTPRMHGLHHSTVGMETNSNYAVVFRWWDRLHGTLRLNVPQAQVVIGVPGYLRPGDNRLVNLLGLPFLRQLPYWRWPGGKASLRKAVPVADPRIMVE